LLDRGIVIAFPLSRGTRFFDDNWFFSGVAERKHVHIEDLIDSAIFIKQNKLTEKLALFSTGYSGSHSALTAVIKEPFLFHGATFFNAVADLPNHL
jgi:protease II